jgi:hypothetical protein
MGTVFSRISTIFMVTPGRQGAIFARPPLSGQCLFS